MELVAMATAVGPPTVFIPIWKGSRHQPLQACLLLVYSTLFNLRNWVVEFRRHSWRTGGLRCGFCYLFVLHFSSLLFLQRVFLHSFKRLPCIRCVSSNVPLVFQFLLYSPGSLFISYYCASQIWVQIQRDFLGKWKKKLDISISKSDYIKEKEIRFGHEYECDLEVSLRLAALWGFEPVAVVSASWEVGRRENPKVSYEFQRNAKHLPLEDYYKSG
jgi:hypothetical protein